MTSKPIPPPPPGEKYRVVIAEDHTIIRDGLRSLISSTPGFEVVAEAADGLEAIAMVRRHTPHVILMDLSMPKMTGTEAIREISHRYPQTKIVALTVSTSEEIFLAAVDAGANSFLMKDTSYPELIAAVRDTLAGRSCLKPGISAAALETYRGSRARDQKPRTELERLTPRERQVIKLIAEGHTNRAIAELLHISPKTVERHRSNLMEKLDLHSVSALTVFAVNKGLLGQEPG